MYKAKARGPQGHAACRPTRGSLSLPPLPRQGARGLCVTSWARWCRLRSNCGMARRPSRTASAAWHKWHEEGTSTARRLSHCISCASRQHAARSKKKRCYCRIFFPFLVMAAHHSNHRQVAFMARAAAADFEKGLSNTGATTHIVHEVCPLLCSSCLCLKRRFLKRLPTDSLNFQEHRQHSPSQSPEPYKNAFSPRPRPAGKACYALSERAGACHRRRPKAFAG